MPDFAAKRGAVDELIELIRDATFGIWKSDFKEKPWDSAGTIEFSARSKSLIVNQTELVHEEITAIIRQLRNPLKPGESIALLASTPMEKRIQQELDRETSIDFNGTPLDDAIKHLASRHEIPILLDDLALAYEEIEIDQPISSRLGATRSALCNEIQLGSRPDQ